MIFIDYPPGGLGHFIAQLFTNSISFNSFTLEYHATPVQNYDDELATTSEQDFLKKLPSWKPSFEVSIGHSYGNTNKINFLGKIYQVVINKDITTYILTQQIKTGTYKSDQLKDYILTHYGKVSNSTVRENYALQYNYYKTNKTYLNTVSNRTDAVIEFDNFYQDEKTFSNEVLKINPNIDTSKVYQHFLKTQKIIFDKKQLYKNILYAVSNKIEFDLTSLTIIDQGLISGMLNELYPFKEWQIPISEEWFTNTKEIVGALGETRTPTLAN